LVGTFADFSWIRCEGKGSFLNSPLMKSFGDGRIAAGERCLVVDLEACTGMDSTFMGTLAGLASRISATAGGEGRVQIADSGPRNRRSLEDLGLDFLLEIDPPSAEWQDRRVEIRANLAAPQKAEATSDIQRAKQVLEAHQTLSGANEKNARIFSNVVSILEEELIEKQKDAKSSDER
jgi:anti-sigma B factor antagonist